MALVKDPEVKPPTPEPVLIAEAQAYRENLVKHGLFKGNLWWARLLAMVESRDATIVRMRFCAKSRRWFTRRCTTQVSP